MPSESGPTSPTATVDDHRKNSIDASDCNGRNGTAKLMRPISYDPTEYVQKARVTKAAPPKPAYNPMQFVQMKPCNLYQTAQEQLKKSEEVKKVKEVVKEDAEEWQYNLDNWKSSRRKRVEHIIDRVVEVKKLELVDHDRNRRKSKTFSEMMEERGTRRKISLPIYAEDESNDLSDLGIGTSSASCKSSVSEDYDNNSVISDNDKDTEKSLDSINPTHLNGGANRDYTSSPGYDTSSSTAPASSPDPSEYTYEGAIQDYKQRVSRAGQPQFGGNFSKDSTPERMIDEPVTKKIVGSVYTPRKKSFGAKIEDKMSTFDGKAGEEEVPNGGTKKDLPKVDITKRRELFEKEKTPADEAKVTTTRLANDFASAKSIKERLSSLGKPADEPAAAKKINRLSGDIPTIRDRFSNLEKQLSNGAEKPTKIDVELSASLKDRLTSLQSAVNKEEVKKPIVLVDIQPAEELAIKEAPVVPTPALPNGLLQVQDTVLSLGGTDGSESENLDTDREDSGIHTTDVSCSVSQADEQNEERIEELNHIEEHKESSVEKEQVALAVMPDLLTPQLVQMETISINAAESCVEHQEQFSFSNDPDDGPTDQQDISVIEALELALQEIDSETGTNPANEAFVVATMSQPDVATVKPQPIYENLEEIEESVAQKFEPSSAAGQMNDLIIVEGDREQEQVEEKAEDHYQVPKPVEPYYEVPKKIKPIPVYENVDMFYVSGDVQLPIIADDIDVGSCTTNTTSLLTIATKSFMEPPKEKPPPPPVDETTDGEESNEADEELEQPKYTIDNFKRINSTKRIKKEIRNKRSSFLGIEGSLEDDNMLALSVAPPPDMAALLKEEKRLEKQMFMKAGFCDNSDTGESRDSGVSENHSRQSSDPSSATLEHMPLNDTNIIELLVNEERRRSNETTMVNDDFWNQDMDDPKLDEETRIQCLEDQIREQEEVLRVERELLQLEQEELKRQRENLLIRENLARHELDHGAKMLMSTNRQNSLQNINNFVGGHNNVSNGSSNNYANLPMGQYHHSVYQIQANYRQSMPDLQNMLQDHNVLSTRVPPSPPAKPQRVGHYQQEYGQRVTSMEANLDVMHARQSSAPGRYHPSQMPHTIAAQPDATSAGQNVQYGNMTKHTLHALSAVPKSKLTNNWVQHRKSEQTALLNSSPYANVPGSGSTARLNDAAWLLNQQKRKSDPQGFNYNKHWLIQEAEQRRIEQQCGVRAPANGGGKKPLPDSVIQTITQRVQSLGIGDRRRKFESSPTNLAQTPPQSAMAAQQDDPSAIPILTRIPETNDKILSVSGKKKCSHCGQELGRGAAMIIESLRLFYHIDCFKCCVCRVQLGDGMMGTDVRVRHNKLHCHNCYSSDDGVKFSCV